MSLVYNTLVGMLADVGVPSAALDTFSVNTPLDGVLFVSDLFISYSRQDQAFVRRLHDALTAHQHNVFVDWAGIPASAEWMKEIQDAITRSDAVLFILSPEFAASPTCRSELALAEDNKKRLIPIVYRDVPPPDVPDALAKLNWIFMRES